MPPELTDKQRRFVEEYLVDLNAKQAAIRAGYGVNTARQVGHETLHRPAVADAIAEAFAARSARTEITQDWVIERLVENVNRAMTAEPVRGADGAETGEYRYDGAVANKALELLGKHVGMWPNKVEHTGRDGGPIETTEVGADRDVARRIALLLSRADGDQPTIN